MGCWQEYKYLTALCLNVFVMFGSIYEMGLFFPIVCKDHDFNSSWVGIFIRYEPFNVTSYLASTASPSS